MSEQFIESSFKKEDVSFEVPLRPKQLDEFVGQDAIRDRLAVLIGAAKKRKEPLGHCLFFGPPGLGKTTLAHIIARAMGGNLVVASGPVIEIPGDLAGILTNLQEGDVLFIDEIHRLNKNVEEYLYPAIEDFVLDLVIDKGPFSRSVQTKLNQFTLIGATTRSGMISAPLRSRFQAHLRLDYYTPELIAKILTRSAHIMNLELDQESLFEVAHRCRGTPRIANNLLRWVRDYLEMHQHIQKSSLAKVRQALHMLAIDERGLDEMDKKILAVIIEQHGGGPVGIGTIAASVGEEGSTIEEVYEPYLLMEGFIKRTSRGREATELAYRHLNLTHLLG
ncbi:MAG: Holliday junction ATP-dependent helicase RuvB [Chlamydiales bacterium]|jgi:Holliday junction DNA helicase RuvB|nr:Holliday junction ATP-dependent helicase RuvB [Chlamydiales bacterium]